MFGAIEVAGTDRELGNNTLQLYTGDGPTTLLPDGSTRPCQDGDVLSVQPNGSFQGRPSGTAGPYEVYTLSAKGYVYNPVKGVTIIVPSAY